MFVSHRRLATFASACAIAIAIAGCSGGASRVTPAPNATAPQVQPTQAASKALKPLYYDASYLRGARLLGPAHFANLSVDLVLQMSDPQGLRDYAQSVSQPQSANYRHFLTPQQIADRFGASKSAQAEAVKYFGGYGLHVAGWSQRMMLAVRGTQANLEAALNTTFGAYSVKGRVAIAPIVPPRLPANLAVAASTNIVHRYPKQTSTAIQGAGNGRLGGLSPQQIAAAYDYTGAYAAGFTGAGVTVGIIGTGPVSTPAPGHEGDVEYFKSTYGVTGASAVTVIPATDADLAGNAASGFATPPPVTASSASCNNNDDSGAGEPGLYPSISPTLGCNPEDGEAQIDTEQVASLAYDSAVQFFLAYNPNDGCYAANGKEVFGSPCPAPSAGAPAAGSPGGAGFPLQGLGEIDEELQSAIHHNTADILSMSFGASEQSFISGSLPPDELDATGHGIQPMEMAALAAEGIALFVSSGDAGAEACQATGPNVDADQLCVSYPETDPNVVAVGGVNTPVNSAGTLIGPLQGWGLTTGNGQSGSGGGVSLYFPLPAYQQGVAGIIGANRNVPDIALEADQHTGVASVQDADPSLGGAYFHEFGGTSVAAPESAAMWALVLQACKSTPTCDTGPKGATYRLGNPDPLLYAIYDGTGGLPYADVFYDVTFGDNALVSTCVSGAAACPSPTGSPFDPGYGAGAGYDRVTGIGVPFARHLIKAVVGI